ncbi:hypothetical protein GALMADRAFT_232649 [Galerina marginata CBS 339.88]|uniref:DUF6533 domain-containing protein n=1 Tax=Galerina marginata (strain CBS 339.88) TaxID=685588 RepID=A0A067SEX3_GALM3|nr:hypothetical protein GALMADRAFT_232649 [Galerina marginata CBS 339.88]
MSELLGPHGFWEIETTKYSLVSATSILFFDYACTFDREVELIWKSRWSLPKILFLINRYYIILAEFFCVHLYKWVVWSGVISFMLSGGILQIRLYALYFMDKKIICLTMSCFLVSSSVFAWIAWLQGVGDTAITLPTSNGSTCVLRGPGGTFYKSWLAALSFECLMCFLACRRAYRSFRADVSPLFWGRTLMDVIIRDSVLYFIVIAIAYLVSLVLWFKVHDIAAEVPVSFTVAMSSILTNRMLLNIRSSAIESTSTLDVEFN